MRHGVAAHGAAEHQQNGGEYGGLDHGEGDAEHYLPLGSVEYGRGLLKVGVHVAENAAYQDVGEGGVVQSQDYNARKQPHAPPGGHLYAQRGGQQAVGGAGDGVGVEEVLPHDGESPLRHDVGEDKDAAQVFAEGQVRPRDEEGHDAAEEYGHNAGAHAHEQGVYQRGPEVGLCQVACKEVYVVDERVSLGLAGEVGVYGAGVYRYGVLDYGRDRREGCDGHYYAHKQEYDVVGLREVGLEPVEEYGRPAGPEGA